MLRAAEEREPWVYAIVAFLVAYIVFVLIYLCQQRYKRSKWVQNERQVYDAQRSRLGVLVLLLFALYFLFELGRRLIGGG